jgi:hypothetical protein
MYEKDNKYYADWRDRQGKRKRKSFTSPKAALRFEEEQKEIARPKKRGVGKLLPTFSTPKPSKGRNTARIVPFTKRSSQ